MQPPAADDEHDCQHRQRDGLALPLVGIDDGVARPPQDAAVGSGHPQRGRELGACDEDGRRAGEADQHRVGHQEGHDAQTGDAEHDADQPDDQRQERGELDVVDRAEVGLAGQRTQREQAGQRHGPGLEPRRGHEGGRDQQRQAGRQQAHFRRQGRDLRIGDRLRDQHEGDADPRQRVAQRHQRSGGRGRPHPRRDISPGPVG